MTKKFLRLPIKLEGRILEGVWYFRIEISREAALEFTLGLCLLAEELVDRLAIAASGGRKIGIGIDPEVAEVQRAVASWKEGKAGDLQLYLSKTELRYWQYFLLGYVRDGAAPVDHIDVEGEMMETREEMNVMLQVDNGWS